MVTDTVLKGLAVVCTGLAAVAAFLSWQAAKRSARAAERSAGAAEESHNLSRQLAAEREREATPDIRMEATWKVHPPEGKVESVRVSVVISNLSSRGNAVVDGKIGIVGAEEPTTKRFADLPLGLAPYEALKLRDVVFKSPPDSPRPYRWKIELRDIFGNKHLWPPAGREVKTQPALPGVQ